MSEWKRDIAFALLEFNKPQPLAKIYTAVKVLRSTRGASWPLSAEDIIRRTLQMSSSDTTSFKPSAEDLFYNAEIGSGLWSLREKARNKFRFEKWLSLQDKSDRTATSYSSAVGTISRELSAIFKKEIDLYTLQDVYELEGWRKSYFMFPEAWDKNRRGNDMYGRAFELYIQFFAQSRRIFEEIKLFDNIDVQEMNLPDRITLEGELVERKVLTYKRNQQNVIACKKRDNYTCVPCGFFYKKMIVEAHHMVPLHLSKTTGVKVDDLITLCPTCHRLAHALLPHDKTLQGRDVLVARLKKERFE